ncbi:MAG: hypothetical protein KatS3mg109_0674 [Pirellulaceae bacterium]|nr:MAG: hypothetical protein KatS3mg109_0614 [Pirellulaceae bacterium]GIW90242.1 MAG: hypothetical protein KatS3mg109_0674 [Pirellulaceae bacterium]
MSVTFTTATCRDEKFVNLSNANFQHLMTALGYDLAELNWVGQLDPTDLLARIAKCLAAIAQGHGDEFTRSAQQTKKLFDPGRDIQGIIDNLARLAMLAGRAMANDEPVEYA